MTGAWQRTLSGLWLLALPLTGVACVLLSVMPVGLPTVTGTVPSLTLMLVYFWTIFHPRFLPPLAVFLIGLLQDALSGGPIGLGTVVLLGAQQVVLLERRVFTARSFAIAWAGFLLVAVLAMAVEWLLTSLYDFTAVPPRAPLTATAASVALYPVASLVFGRMARLIERAGGWREERA